MTLSGKVALITGGTQGLGRTTAFTLGRAGAKIVVTGRDKVRGEETVRELLDSGITAHFVIADVTESNSGDVAVNETMSHFGGLDIAFNNAGIGKAVSLLDESEESWNATISTNLSGIWRSMKAEINALIKQNRGGSIINNASIWGIRGRPGMAGYSASKHGVIGLTKSSALEFASHNIRVNAVCPGTSDTAMVRRIRAKNEELAALAATYPLRRLVTPDDVANAVMWLASDESSYVTGHELVIDGGFTVGGGSS